MKYAIKLATYAPDMTAEEVISKALGFEQALSHGSVIDLFVDRTTHKNGVFKSKKAATMAAERINRRGSFGGFGQYWTGAAVVVEV